MAIKELVFNVRSEFDYAILEISEPGVTSGNGVYKISVLYEDDRQKVEFNLNAEEFAYVELYSRTFSLKDLVEFFRSGVMDGGRLSIKLTEVA